MVAIILTMNTRNDIRFIEGDLDDRPRVFESSEEAWEWVEDSDQDIETMFHIVEIDLE